MDTLQRTLVLALTAAGLFLAVLTAGAPFMNP